MKQINANHLITISGLMEREARELSFAEKNKYFTDTSLHNSSDNIGMLFDKHSILNIIFGTRNDRPQSNEPGAESFTNTAIFTAKVALTLSILESNESKKLNFANIRDLLEQAKTILPSNNLDAQVFLLTKLINICKQFEGKLHNKLSELIQITCDNIASTKINSESLASSLSNLTNLILKNLTEPDSYIRLMLNKSKELFEQLPINDYPLRYYTMQGIVNSWGLIKNRLNIDDITWLKNVSSDITAQYKLQPKRYQNISQELKNYINFFMNLSLMAKLVGGFSLAFISIQFYVAYLFTIGRIELIQSLKELTELESKGQLNEQESKVLKVAWELAGRFQNIHNLEELAAAAERSEFSLTLLNYYPYVVTGILIPFSFFMYKHFNESSAPRPYPLPSWVDEVESRLNANSAPRLKND